MRILVVGSGGREHALAWRLAQTAEVFAVPGNPGIAEVGTCLPAGDPVAAAEAVGADLVVVGPEAPLVEGVVDRLNLMGRRVVGPVAENARLEGSKIFAKHFLIESGIPTAQFIAVDNQADARRALERFGAPVVIKADGLMAGKGVVVARSKAEAETAVAGMRGPLVIEECLTGEEVSFIALCDGKDCVPLLPTQDHKAVFDGDLGPNTGGMGAYCWSGILTETEKARVLDTVIRPVVERTRFTGFLYAGLMMTADGPKVLEFNVRMGDPETQPLMMMLEGDWAEVLMASAEGRLAGTRIGWKAGAAVCVVLASKGYPGAYETGKAITGIAECGETVFHAGTRIGPRGLETSGGRVLGVTAWGGDLGSAVAGAYDAVERIRFEGMQFRRDIGRKRLRISSTM